jgi:hypothetical protein
MASQALDGRCHAMQCGDVPCQISQVSHPHHPSFPLHHSLHTWMMAKGVPARRMAGTTSPSPSLPAPMWQWKAVRCEKEREEATRRMPRDGAT